MKRITYLIIFFLLIASVIAANISYSKSNMTAKITLKTECNDGIDNDGDGNTDSLDIDCIDVCHNEAGTIIECV